MKECKYCNDVFESKNSNAKFCSNSCSANYQWNNTKTRNKIISKQRQKKLTKEHKEKISTALSGRKLSNEHRKNISKSHFGNMDYTRTVEYRTKMSDIMKRKWKDVDYRKMIIPNMKKSHKSYCRSEAENEIFDYLIKRGYSCVRSKVGKYFPDIIIPDKKIIIEYFGDFWHRNPILYSENYVAHNTTSTDVWKYDKEKIKFLESFGYTVHVIWESEYKGNKNKVLNKIAEILQT